MIRGEAFKIDRLGDRCGESKQFLKAKRLMFISLFVRINIRSMGNHSNMLCINKKTNLSLKMVSI